MSGSHNSERRTAAAPVTAVRTVTVKCRLDTPIYYGNWVMRHREFALVRVDSESGLAGFAYCLTRDGPIADIVGRTISPAYLGASACDPQTPFYRALWANHAVHAAGIGMRALSVVDLAAWDLAAKEAGQSITRFLGGQPRSMPATAIAGYPPTMEPDRVVAQVNKLWGDGWRRFKLPISPTTALSVRRLEAVREALPQAWLGFDINMVMRTADDVLEFERRVRHLALGWIEDVVPPGDAGLVARIRKASGTPVAMGDEQGGSYHPEALLEMGSLDVLRVDATTNGGLTRIRDIVRRATDKGVRISPHMFPHVHSRIMAALAPDVPIEWGVPGTGVHPMDDPLDQPQVIDGQMQPLPERPGFGDLVNLAWLATQETVDPDGAMDDLGAHLQPQINPLT